MIDQPVASNHSIHVNEGGMECTECHIGVENRARATLPTIQICEDCHSEMNGETEAEAFVVAAVENGEEIIWNRIYKLPDHVYFSHRRHISLGKIECTQCHGDIQDFETPPLTPQVELTMEFCMDCHEEQNVNNDCLACHR
ncbi:MAG: cytochrome c3 family protein [Calditrichia bacterium]